MEAKRAKGLPSPARKAPWRSAGTTVTVNRVPREKAPGLLDRIVFQGDAGADSRRLREEVSAATSGRTSAGQDRKNIVTPEGYSDSYDHFKNFFAAVRCRQPVVEDAVFGYRAAGAALLSNLSIERGQW